MITLNMDMPKTCEECPCFRGYSFQDNYCWHSGVIWTIDRDKGTSNENCLIVSSQSAQ